MYILHMLYREKERMKEIERDSVVDNVSLDLILLFATEVFSSFYPMYFYVLLATIDGTA